MTQTTNYTRKPYIIVSEERRLTKEIYGSVGDYVILQGQQLSGEIPSDTAVLAMYPSGSPAYLPLFSKLARAGVHVLAGSSRYLNGEHGLIMEQVLLDLGAFVRDARERLGYRRIILAGWSGGGSVALTYQSQAEHPTITRTPSGEPCDLAGADLIPADGLLLLAAHEGRHRVLTESLDASIIDELNPDRRESDLNLYDRQNGPTAPYSADFLASYRSKQRDRNRRITAWVRDVLEDLNRQGRPQAERCFVVHGTMADPRWLDPSIEPNDRPPNKCFLGDPELVNTGPTGLARFSCLRSWLSQWSLDDAQVDSVKSAPGVTVPVLMVGHSADEAVPTSHTKAVFDALGQKDKQLWTITGADHYLGGPDQRRNADEVVNIATHWMAERDFAEASPESERQLI